MLTTLTLTRRYLGTEVDRPSGFLYIFMEYVPGGSVARMLKQFGTFTEEIISVYTRQILLGLECVAGGGDSGRADTDAPLA